MNSLKISTVLLLLALLLGGCAHKTPAPPDPTDEPTPGTSLPDSTETEQTRPLPPETGTSTEKPFDPIKIKGRTVSKESERLEFFLDWCVETTDGKTATVKVRAGITCYGSNLSINVGSRQCMVSVNGAKKYFSSPQIVKHLEGPENKISIPFFKTPLEFEIELEPDGSAALELNGIWDANLTYQGEYLESLSVGTVILFPEGTQLAPETTEPEQTKELEVPAGKEPDTEP